MSSSSKFSALEAATSGRVYSLREIEEAQRKEDEELNAAEWIFTDPKDHEGLDHFYVETVRDEAWLQKWREEVTEARQRDLVESYVKGFGLARHHIESFDRFVELLIPRIVRENSFQVVDSLTARERHHLHYGHTTTLPPCVRECNGLSRTVQVQECRLRGLTLTVPVVVDITYRVYDISQVSPEALADRTRPQPPGAVLISERVFRETPLGDIPIPDSSRLSHRYQSPALSGEDPYDQGGFFTINGSDKVIICEETQRTNFPLVTRLNNIKFAYALQVRSRNPHKVRSTSNLDLRITHPGRDSGTRVLAQVPYFNNVSIPLVALYRLLGVDSRDAMVHLVLEHRVHRRDLPLSQPDHELETLLREIFSAEEDVPHDPLDLREWVAKLAKKEKENTREKRIKGTDTMLNNEFLPHVGLERNARTVRLKVHYLSFCLFKLCMVYLKRWPADDRDHLQHRRIAKLDLLMAQLFRARMRGIQRFAHRRLKQCLEKGQPININWLINSRSMTTSFKAAISNGNFATQKNGAPSSGASMVLPRQTNAANLSALRRLSIKFNKDGKITKPRHLSPTHPPDICPMSTPEGGMCGLNKELGILTHVRLGSDPELITSWLTRLPENGDFVPFDHPSITEHDRQVLTKISVDGAPVGYSRHPSRLFRISHAAKASSAIPQETTLVFRPWHRSLQYWVDPGCLMHLVIRVAGWHKFHRLWELPPGPPQAAARQRILEGIRLGVLEFVSKDQEESLRIAWHPDMVMIQFESIESKQKDLITRAQRVDRWVESVLSDQRQAHRTAMASHYGEEWDPVSRSWIHRRPLTAQGKEHWRRSLHHLMEASYDHLEPYTHVMVHPTAMFGICACLLVFPERNQGPRNMYGVAHQKAAIAPPPLSSAYRMDAMTIRPWYSQMPLVQTFYDELLNNNEAPQGLNCEVWILAAAYNQEDALLMNQASLQRGLFNSDIARRSQDEEKKRTSDGHVIARPLEHCRGLREANYSKLAVNGVAPPGTRLKQNDAIIGKQIATFDVPENSSQASVIFPVTAGLNPQSVRGSHAIFRDSSVIFKSNEGRVERVMEACSKDGNRTIKMMTRSPHKSEIGDKFSLRQGQKGTLGMIVPPEDMPFSISGRTPDIILNPHAFPSRMTTGTLDELLLGLIACDEGAIGDGTPWNGNHVEDFCHHLQSRGWQWNGREVVIDPRTGKRMLAEKGIFAGMGFVQSQKHLANLKNHARGRGPRVKLTHQPTEGRGKDGGLRFGEMERDCLIAHGAVGMLKDRLLDQSDPYLCPLCCKCHNLAQPAPTFLPAGSVDKHEPFCHLCKTGDYVIFFPMPYCFKLMMQEVMAMCVRITLPTALVGPNERDPQNAVPLWRVIDHLKGRSSPDRPESEGETIDKLWKSTDSSFQLISTDDILPITESVGLRPQNHRTPYLAAQISRAWEKEETQRAIRVQINERIEKRQKRKEAQIEKLERKKQRLLSKEEKLKQQAELETPQ